MQMCYWRTVKTGFLHIVFTTVLEVTQSSTQDNVLVIFLLLYDSQNIITPRTCVETSHRRVCFPSVISSRIL